MTVIVHAIAPARGPAEPCWQQVTAQLAALLRERGVHPARVVVLLPYAQLMQEAKAAWADAAGGSHFVPRFETTMNWAARLGGLVPADGDLRQDFLVKIGHVLHGEVDELRLFQREICRHRRHRPG